MLYTRPSLSTIEVVAKDRKVLFCVFWGSRVYGTATESSDWDVMCVIDRTESDAADFDGVCAALKGAKVKEKKQNQEVCVANVRVRKRMLFKSRATVELEE